jgi:hypothetical protein
MKTARRAPRRRILTAALVLLGSSVLQGCVIETVTAPSGVAVTGPPPEPVRETPPPAPAGHAVWVAGYWHWTGMQYAWIPGHWEAAPPGARWRAPHYSLRDGTYFYEPGGWAPAR